MLRTYVIRFVIENFEIFLATKQGLSPILLRGNEIILHTQQDSDFFHGEFFMCQHC